MNDVSGNVCFAGDLRLAGDSHFADNLNFVGDLCLNSYSRDDCANDCILFVVYNYQTNYDGAKNVFVCVR